MLSYQNPCGNNNCTEVILWLTGEHCQYCNRSFCPLHLKHDDHSCYKAEEEDDEETLEDVAFEFFQKQDAFAVAGQDEKAWLKMASKIYGCDVSQVTIVKERDPMDGGFHRYQRIMLPDADWLLRRRSLAAQWGSTETEYFNHIRYLEDSERATLSMLASAGVCVPTMQGDFERVPEPSAPKSDYCFFNKMTGRRLFEKAIYLEERENQDDMTPEMAANWIKSFAQESVKLSTLKFDRIGSLVPSVDEEGKPAIKVGHMCDWQLFSEGVSPDISTIPIYSTADRYIKHLDLLLELILAKKLRQKNPEIWYLCYLEAKVLIEGNEEMNRVESDFYLMHVDNRLDQFLIDDEGRITAWLDWEFAITTTKAEAFSSPRAFFGSSFKDSTLSIEELALIKEYELLGRPDLGECVKNGKKYVRLRDLLSRFGCNECEVLNGLRDAFLGDDAWIDDYDDCFEQLRIRHANRPEWKAWLAATSEGDVSCLTGSVIEDEVDQVDSDETNTSTSTISSDGCDEVEGKEDQGEGWTYTSVGGKAALIGGTVVIFSALLTAECCSRALKSAKDYMRSYLG